MPKCSRPTAWSRHPVSLVCSVALRSPTVDVVCMGLEEEPGELSPRNASLGRGPGDSLFGLREAEALHVGDEPAGEADISAVPQAPRRCCCPDSAAKTEVGVGDGTSGPGSTGIGQ